MNCEFTEKVSSLIDGELSAEESERVRTHIAVCASCKAAREDFLLLRREIKDSAFIFAPDKGARRTENSGNGFIFGRKITLPAPIFAALLLTLIAVSGSLISSKLKRSEQIITGGTIKKSSDTDDNEPKSSNAESIAKFDGGGRAEIYVRRNQPTTDVGK